MFEEEATQQKLHKHESHIEPPKISNPKSCQTPQKKKKNVIPRDTPISWCLLRAEEDLDLQYMRIQEWKMRVKEGKLTNNVTSEKKIEIE